MAAPFTRTKFAMLLQVADPNGPGWLFEVVAASATFTLNRIPFASVTLGVGRNARTGRPAEIHTNLQQLPPMARARLVLFPSGQWSAAQARRDDRPDHGLWDIAGSQTIFEGYLTGLGVQRVRGSLQVSLQMVHWLADLAFSSIFSEQSHPGNPANLTHQAVYRVNGATSSSSQSAFIGSTRFFNHLSPGAVSADLWSALGNMFCEVAEEDLIQLGSPGQCGGIGGQTNSYAKEALARIQGTHSCATHGNTRHVPLAFDSLGTVGGLVADSIRRSIGQDMLSGWWSSTVWDKLVSDLAPRFMFHIVPLVDTAIVAPFVPGLRSTWSAKVIATDHTQLYVTSYVRRPLRGVGIYAGREAKTVPSDPNTPNIAQLSGIGGCFIPNPDRRGMILLRKAPTWMAMVPAFATSAAVTTRGGLRRLQPTGSATTPQAPATLVSDVSGSGAAVATNDLYARMAQYIYMLEVLRGRTGILAGKFRLDIAPGSTISIEQRGDPFVGRQNLAPDLVASVMSVSFGLDAEASKAMTVFQLAHIRSLSENTSPETSVADHPLYAGRKFVGAPLVEDYLFDT